jgi:SpoVK/Ycf46/Vps4 family AAA+-type ATPase
VPGSFARALAEWAIFRLAGAECDAANHVIRGRNLCRDDSQAARMDESVAAALEAAVKADPSNTALRVHLASLLVLQGDAHRALEHAQAALAVAPDDVPALAAARDAARASGDADRAKAYARLLGPVDSRPPEEENTRLPAGGDSEANASAAEDSPERPQVTLADVGGLEEVKARLDSAFLAPLRNPELRRYYGKSLRGGLLLFGPPGCGKTFLARAVAGELGAHFFAVGLSDVLDMWLGESERRLHGLFEQARRAAPCVLFLDELDALGQKRSQMRHSAGRNVVNQLLSELDGAVSNNEGVFVLAATNHPWDVDTALRRPGRLDRTLLVLPPDQPARAAILTGALAERPVDRVDVGALARRTEGYSGADLTHLVEVASEHALQESIRTGDMRPIKQAQLDKARAEVPPSTRAWFSVAHNYAVYANEGGQYDDLLAYVRNHKLL